MKFKLIFCDPEKCVGCQMCELACSLTKEKGINPRLSRIRLVRIEPFVMMPVSCRLCEDYPCVKSCPRNALSVNFETGIVRVDEKKCNGCSWCINACPFGAINLNSDRRRVFICDMCEGEPRCVEFCPVDALNYASHEEFLQQIRKKSIEKLLQELIKS
ncbi:MAG: 4Fe-4S dicluster domain-containing protein [Candidatus Bathyarchaeia archaeon]